MITYIIQALSTQYVKVGHTQHLRNRLIIFRQSYGCIRIITLYLNDIEKEIQDFFRRNLIPSKFGWIDGAYYGKEWFDNSCLTLVPLIKGSRYTRYDNHLTHLHA